MTAEYEDVVSLAKHQRNHGLSAGNKIGLETVFFKDRIEG